MNKTHNNVYQSASIDEVISEVFRLKFEKSGDIKDKTGSKMSSKEVSVQHLAAYYLLLG